MPFLDQEVPNYYTASPEARLQGEIDDTCLKISSALVELRQFYEASQSAIPALAVTPQERKDIIEAHKRRIARLRQQLNALYRERELD